MFRGAEDAVAEVLFRCIMVDGILRRVVGRFRFLRHSTRCLPICFSLAEKLIRMNPDENLAHALIWGLGGGIFHCLTDSSWINAPRELWSVLGVFCVFRSDTIYRLMRFVGSRLLRQVKRIDWRQDDALDLLGVDIIRMFTGLLDLVRPDWLASADLSQLLIRILRRTPDADLAHASFLLLAHQAKLEEGLIPADVASLSIDLFNSGPGFAEDAVEMAYAIFLDAPDVHEWYGCAIWALGFGDNEPETEFSWEAKLFYTVCISVCSQMHPECLLPPAVDFLPLLCLLLASEIPEPAFVSLLLGLLLRYADICAEDQDAAVCFIQLVGDPYTGDALAEYLDNGHHQVRTVWQALQDFTTDWAMEVPEQ
jgi:hypothetical protein